MRKLVWPTVLALIFLLILSCAPAILKPGLIPAGPGEVMWARKILAKMTLKEKIGQMIVCRYMGRFVSSDSDYLENLVELIRREKIGGLIISGGEVYETAHLTNFLQQQAKIPLLISADFEWGAAMRINGTTLFPPFMAMTAAASDDLVYQMGRITAIESRAMGIHMTYAPVVDVNINPDNPIISIRSLGEDSEVVGWMATAFIRGCQENGLVATAKHFPGHGDTNLDSHTLLPTITGDRCRLDKVELYPFTRTIQAGVEAIMTAHLSVPALDPTPNLPATLSYSILTELLRKELGFKGLIVTDALEMGAITKSFSGTKAAVQAIQAGVDLLLLPPDPAGAIDALIRAVSSGEIPESRIDASAAKILDLKARLGLHRNRLVEVSHLPFKVATKEHLESAALAFEKSVTLVKNEADVLPFAPERLQKKMAVFSLSSDAGDYYAGNVFVKEIEKRRPGITSFFADSFTGQEYIERAKEEAKDADTVVLALFSSLRTAKGSVDLVPQHIDLVKEFIIWPARVIVISFGSPYFLRHFPEVDAYLCLYRNTAEAQVTAARALFGDVEINGRLPVSIPGLHPAGHGLNLPKKSLD